MFLGLTMQFVVGYAPDRADDDVLSGAYLLTIWCSSPPSPLTAALVLKHQLFDRDGLLRRML